MTRAATRPATPPAAREIPVHRTATRGGTPLIVGVVDASSLRRTFTIPRRDARTKSGYQRELSQSRVNRLVKDLRGNRVDLPTSILVNLRDFDAGRHLVERKGRLFFRHGDESLFVVDGQHRVEALVRLVDEDEARWGEFEIPFVCMLGASEREEIRQFYVVNSTAKSVRTDLALDLLKQRAESEPGLIDALIESGETWKVKGQQVVEDLSKSRLWRGRTRFPGEPKGETTIGSAGFVGSLRPLLNTPYFGALTPRNQVKILDAYWEGIARVVPECFVRPTEYTLQKTTGVNVMHGLLVSVLEYVRSVGRSVVEPEVYADVLAGVLPELEGDTTSGEIVRGSDFWLGAGEGAAGSYSSNAGRRVLTAKLRGLLPPIEVE
jgi:DGQHR domain-containing protein